MVGQRTTGENRAQRKETPDRQAQSHSRPPICKPVGSARIARCSSVGLPKVSSATPVAAAAIPTPKLTYEIVRLLRNASISSAEVGGQLGWHTPSSSDLWWSAMIPVYV